MTELSKYDGKHVRIKDTFGESFTGVADHLSSEFCLHEYGEEEDGISIDDYLIFASQIAEIEEIEVHGTTELRTERLTLRRFRADDAFALYEAFGKDTDPWLRARFGAYAAPGAAEETVRRMSNERFYSWVMDSEDVVFGMIEAFDHKEDRIRVGIGVIEACRRRGYATEALKTTLDYLTENEGISLVTADCAADNIAAGKTFGKVGMKLARTEKRICPADGREYDRLTYEYRKNN